MVSIEYAKELIKKYGEAWVNQDVEKILSIFSKNGTYSENIFKNPFRGHKEIASYWKKRVCKDQSNIKFKVLNIYTSGNTIIAEWEASFYSNIKNARLYLKEVAIIKIKNGLITSLREYWQVKKTTTKI